MIAQVERILDESDSRLMDANVAPNDGPLWLAQLHAEAQAQADTLKVPTTQHEEWRFTDLGQMNRLSFQPPTPQSLQHADIAGFLVPEAVTRLVFVNGVYAAHLSVQTASAGLLVTTLAEALPTHGSLIQAHLARHAHFDAELFTARNTSALLDGALVIIRQDHSAQAPIHLLFVSTPQISPSVSYPRCLIVAERDSRCTLIEDFVSLGTDTYLNIPVTEIVVSEGAEVSHARLQREARTAFHIAHCAVSLARDAVYTSVSVALGARLSRLKLDVAQEAQGTMCTLDGLALISARQLADTHSFIDHRHAHGKSRQLHKCIVDEAAHAVFNGKVFVRRAAQQTDSAQSSRNLLLSGKARVDTKPQLEIFADDVKCAHGATVGQLDAEELFYLQSRGLSELAARNLLTYAFAAEIINRIPVPSLVAQLRRTVLENTRVAHLDLP